MGDGIEGGTGGGWADTRVYDEVSIPDPNPACYDCPVLEQDRTAAQSGWGLALDDLRRHNQESRDCAGTSIVQKSGGQVIACSLYGEA